MSEKHLSDSEIEFVKDLVMEGVTAVGLAKATPLDPDTSAKVVSKVVSMMSAAHPALAQTGFYLEASSDAMTAKSGAVLFRMDGRIYE